MDVVDFLKKKKEMLANKHFEVSGIISPVRDYWNEFSQTVNTQFGQWFSNESLSALDQKGIELPVAAQLLLADLSLLVGQETHIGQWHLVTQDQIDQFADVTKDHQWIHTDPERAAEESPYRTTVAHGFLTLGLIPYLTDNVNPDKPLYPEARVAINTGLNNVRFIYPVKAGVKVRARSKLVSVVEVNRGLEVVTEITIEIENVRRPACIAQTVQRLMF